MQDPRNGRKPPIIPAHSRLSRPIPGLQPLPSTYSDPTWYYALAALAPQGRQIAHVVLRERPAGRGDVGRDLFGPAHSCDDRTDAVLRCQPRHGEFEYRVPALTREGFEFRDLGMALVRNLFLAENSVHEGVGLEP